MALYVSTANGSINLQVASGNINHNAAYTTAFWIYLTADANDYGHFWAASTNADQYENSDLIGVDADGTTLTLGCYLSGGGGGLNGSSLSTGTWYHLAVVRESVTSLKAYLNGALDINVTTTDVTSRASCVNELVSRLNTLYGFNGRIAHFKQWQAALTIDEVKAEMRSIRPLRFTNLNRWTPMVNTTVGSADDSLYGSSWTPTGTWSVLDGPPVPWGNAVIVYPYAGAAAPVTGNPWYYYAQQG